MPIIGLNICHLNILYKMPYQCFCNTILKNDAPHFIEDHMRTKIHYNILTRPYNYWNCPQCQHPIDKNNKKAIDRHLSQHFDTPCQNYTETCMIDGKIVTHEDFCHAIDELVKWDKQATKENDD